MKDTFRTTHAATAATLANAACGLIACALALAEHPELAALTILAAVLMDALDGALARSLGTTDEFGAQLDSMADLISFGVAPAVLVGSLLPAGVMPVGWALILVYPLCAAWRLARFNADAADPEEGHSGFEGLPSTGGGAAAATAVLIALRADELGLSLGSLSLPAAMVFLGGLMLSRIHYRHAGVAISRLRPSTAVGLAAVFVAASVLWQYQYAFCALIWYYVLSGPLGVAREKIRAVRHA